MSTISLVVLVVLVVCGGIAALPWTNREVRSSARAFTTASTLAANAARAARATPRVELEVAPTDTARANAARPAPGSGYAVV